MPQSAPLCELAPGQVDLATLRTIYQGGVRLSLSDDAWEQAMDACATVVNIVDSGETVYGINTGFGRLAQTAIPHHQLEALQRNLILSHSCGVGEPLPDAVVRLVLAIKIISLGRGCSGVRPVVIEHLLALFNAGVLPLIPEKGSVGASGDLAPLAHMALVLIGEGSVIMQGEHYPASEGLERAGIAPLTLGPKEGLALLNGTQVSTALALRGLFEAENIFAAGLVAGALSSEAIKGSVKPLDRRIHEARGQVGQIAVAGALRGLLNGSPIVASHQACSRVQDPYSIRCVPQVMGACLDNLCYAARVLAIEANAASDNPLVFSEDGIVLSGGNFHAEPVAFAADIIALAVAEIGAISERRIALLLDAQLSGLPPFLINEGGLNSGFMIAQVTAAALASENKSLAHPGSVDSLPTSANQEDHVSMAAGAARRLGAMCFNSATIVGIEAMAAAQGIHFHRPLRSTPLLENVLAAIRQRVPWLDKDRYMAPDIEAMRLWATGGQWPQPIMRILPSGDGHSRQRGD
ncbi:histidine ammonia-lyase [Shimwellia pseudoproteus]|uniref:histidine ammonia-lyase n=1 Tax=Shimwellia pseudoproteus TaxID=570012 RepID=UPI0018ED30EB|nr:histidine ammonia-lyase [Shimwellia pseudoproteus]MBJ3813959.1 histidine ammonia-lyase [Shimwellia pseudoproteus]